MDQPSGLQSPFTPRHGHNSSSNITPTRGALRDVSSTEKRRNSPVFPQLVTSKKEMSDDVSSSPVYSGSPYTTTQQKDSPRNFWLTKEHQENGPDLRHSSSVLRRSSLERLKRASRVQNNKLLHQAQSIPNGARPMSLQPDHAAFNTHRTRRDSADTRPTPVKRNSIPSPQSPPKISSIMRGEGTQASRMSPTKSSILSPYRVNNDSGAHDSEEILSSPGRRKGVTFDDAPPCVLQYDLITPDPSVSGSSTISYDSEEDEDDEDIENVPVIEPDHWSEQPEKPQPQFANDRYTSTPSPTGRPLPPLPGMLVRSDSNRPLPYAPKSPLEHSVEETDEEPSEYTDGEMTPTKETSRTFEDELESLQSSLQDGGDERDERDEARDKLEALSDDSFDFQLQKDEKQQNHEEEEKEYHAPRISRESIMRQVEARRSRVPSSTYSFSMHDDEGMNRGSLDYRDDDSYSVSEGDAAYDVSFNSSDRASIAPSITASVKSSEGGKESRRGSDLRNSIPKETESEQKETQGIQLTEATTLSPQVSPEEAEINKKISTPPTDRLDHRMSLPEIQDNIKSEGLGLREFMTPSPPPPRTTEPETDTETEYSVVVSETEDEGEDPMRVAAMKFLEDNRPCTPENQRIPPPTDEEMRTPESVIHHAVDDYSDYTTDDYDETDQELEAEDDDERSVDEETEDDEERCPTPTPEAPIPIIIEAPEKTRSPSPIPEEVATIKASGSRLKTRPSVTPADMATMAAARRKVSGTHPVQPQADQEIPPLPKHFGDEKEDGAESGSESGSDVSTERGDSEAGSPTLDRKMSLSRSALPPLSEFGLDLGLEDLSQEFEKVIEAQKRGYLMRQNTKVVHATSDEVSSPREAFGHSRTQSWGSVEPWKNDRRKSGRKSGGRRDILTKGGVPPLPGQESAVLASVEEQNNTYNNNNSLTVPDIDPHTGMLSDEEQPISAERGRLFVKVLGVKELNLPLPQGQPTYFCLTLDNGLHCVTTSWLELGKNAPIGQEFELVVMNDLEFQLTLQTKLEPPPIKRAPTPVKAKPPVQKKSTFNKLFQSPKKRREAERLAEEERRKQQEQQAASVIPPPTTAWDLLNEIVGEDGSFARSYVCLKDFESRAYGRSLTTEINCFNEWAVDTSSVRRKQGVPPIKRAPYKIGKLEVQLLYVPRPKQATDADMPKSMNSAIREIKEAENTMAKEHEGFLSQQGGDCPFWRRRYFKLNGSKLTAYHEATRRPRATIDLQKAVKLIDDRSSLTEKTVSGAGKSRRKSGFSEEEEGYMFVEEGFRIRFANGEVIDFYADTGADKKAWMAVLGDTIGKVPSKKGWCDIIFAHEKMLAEREEEIKKEQERIAAAKAASQLSRAPAVASPRHPYAGPNPNRNSMAGPPPPPKPQPQGKPRPMSQVPPSPNRYNPGPPVNRLAASPRLPPPTHTLR